MATARNPKDEYVRQATIVSITDGDTVVLDTDLGCDIRLTQKCRLSGINAPEKNTQAGKDAKKYIESLLAVGDSIVIKTYKDEKEKYGRYLAVLFLPNSQVSVNQTMIDAGHAVPYNGEKRS
jgi:micrococcal nuclease